jgi:hypothetical protein
MSALLLFGRSVEKRLGTCLFVWFYLVAGFFATGLQFWHEPTSTWAQVGASGSTWAVTAAYLTWFPRAKVRSVGLVPLLNIPLPLPAINVWLFLASATAVGAFWSFVLRHAEQAADGPHPEQRTAALIWVAPASALRWLWLRSSSESMGGGCVWRAFTSLSRGVGSTWT